MGHHMPILLLSYFEARDRELAIKTVNLATIMSQNESLFMNTSL